MFRNTLLGLAAVLTLGAAALLSTASPAKAVSVGKVEIVQEGDIGPSGTLRKLKGPKIKEPFAAPFSDRRLPPFVFRNRAVNRPTMSPISNPPISGIR